MSNGNVYAWGLNNLGNLGVREVIGHLNDKVIIYPKKVNIKEDVRAIDFDLGNDTLLVVLEDGKVYFSGMDDYIPKLIRLP